MRKLLVVVFVLMICVVGFAFYRGWFTLSSPDPAGGSNQVNINLATDPDKMQEDAEAVKDKAAELTGGSTDTEDVSADGQTNDIVKSNDP